MPHKLVAAKVLATWGEGDMVKRITQDVISPVQMPFLDAVLGKYLYECRTR